jgi:hypothetical protein
MLLPIVISELCSALEPVVGPDELLWQVAGWLDGHRDGSG